jgi:hypothetical protein
LISSSIELKMHWFFTRKSFCYWIAASNNYFDIKLFVHSKFLKTFLFQTDRTRFGRGHRFWPNCLKCLYGEIVQRIWISKDLFFVLPE